MSTPTLLETHAREGVGSRASRKARAAGRVPVNVYGHGQANAALTVDAHDVELALLSTAQVFTLKIAGQDESCLVREVQYDTYGQRVLHVDFTRIDLSEEVEVEVALEFRGHAAGVTAGGQLVVHHNTFAVRCRADSIPDVIVVDVSAVELGESIHANEVSLPEGVVLDEHHFAVDEPIVGVAATKEEEVEAVAEADEAAGAGAAAPTEGGEKKSED